MDIPCHHWDCHWGFLTERWPVARRKHCSPPRWRVAVVAKSVAVAAAVGDGGSSSRDQTSGANVGNFCGSPWTRRLPSRKDWPSDLSSGRPTKPPFFPVSTHNQQVAAGQGGKVSQTAHTIDSIVQHGSPFLGDNKLFHLLDTQSHKTETRVVTQPAS